MGRTLAAQPNQNTPSQAASKSQSVGSTCRGDVERRERGGHGGVNSTWTGRSQKGKRTIPARAWGGVGVKR